MVALGRENLLAKVDIISAHRIVPVHPEDRPLVRMKWKEALYVDTCMPCGLWFVLFPKNIHGLDLHTRMGAKHQVVTCLLYYLRRSLYHHEYHWVKRVCSEYGCLLRDIQKTRSTKCC